MDLLRFYRKIDETFEYCFYVESEKLNEDEVKILTWLLSETFEPENFGTSSFFDSKSEVVEIGPRMNFETAFSTNGVSICHACGLDKVKRIERSRRYILPKKADRKKFIEENQDRMTEYEYEKPLTSFRVDAKPEPVSTVNLIKEGPDALRKINSELGLGMDNWDIDFYHNLFVNDIGRNPTNMECFQLGQANSEHSRHWFFKGKIVIDGEEMPETLFKIIQSTLEANPDNSVIAFKDNSSAIKGYKTKTISPSDPVSPSPFEEQEPTYHPILTAETHNFPCSVAPFSGGETGTGGRIRDVHATGSSSLVVAGTAGFCTGNLNITGYEIAGEDKSYEYPSNLASPLKILLDESSGAFDYGNKFGEPSILGFTRTFGQTLPNGERREWIKPIEFSGGVGQLDDRHTEKQKPKKGMLIVQIGGPAYRIGVGGGSASSMVAGENRAELDFNAVQRGDAEMEQKMNRAIRACVELGDENPILSIHDQGAGGPCNVLTEIVEPEGGRIDIRKIKVGDQTMSLLEIWSAEYQERDAMLVDPKKIELFKNICERERVNYEILGEITGDGRVVVHDSETDTTPVNLDIEKILGKMPQKTFESKRVQPKLEKLKLPKKLSVSDALKKVFSLPSVGSKGFLVRKVDRSVTGLVAQQQCVGPLQLPLSNVGVVAQSHFSTTGTATAVGEQPVKMLIDPRAGARMALGEMLMNMMWARISNIRHIKSSVNWMWAAKMEGEGAALYDAADALRNIMIETGVAADGGKDSLSMASKVGKEIVKAPGQMTVSAYSSMPDITKVITPDIKRPGESKLMFVDLGAGKNRLGGSALAQAFGQIGDETPDIESGKILVETFAAVQKLIDENLILSGHDRSDGGLATTLTEIAMAGNCGLEVNIDNEDTIASLFSEELGFVIEFLPEHEEKISKILDKHKLDYAVIGKTKSDRQVIILNNDETVLDEKTSTLLSWWEATSDRLEEEQTSKKFAIEQAKNHDRPEGPKYDLSFTPTKTDKKLLKEKNKPKVAVIREEGSNGDREMSSAFYAAGFEVWDINMFDLLNDKINLDEFRGVAFGGGFSYADVLDSSKGWAGTIKFNEKLKKMFTDFYERPDTFSLGVCNGCQLSALLGWVPWSDIEGKEQPRFVHNSSGRFESRWTNVKIEKSPSIMLAGMEESSLGVWVAHGEGRLHCPDKKTLAEIKEKKLIPLRYIDDSGEGTESYPFNPNGSPVGIAGLVSPDGRHLALMPHPERVFLKWQWPHMPEAWKKDLQASPWLQMFQNARKWCDNDS